MNLKKNQLIWSRAVMTDHLQPVTSIQSLRSGCSTCLSYRPNDTFHSHGDSSLMRVMKSCLWLSYLAREVCAVPAISTHASNQPLFHTQNHFGGVRFNTRLHIRTAEKQRERESASCVRSLFCMINFRANRTQI